MDPVRTVQVVPTKDMDLEKFTSLFNEVENCLHMDHPNICRVFEACPARADS